MDNDYYKINNPYLQYNRTVFGAEPPAPLAKPIETVQKSIEGAAEVLIKPDDERKKKNYSAAIAAGSSVIVLSALVALLNPKYSNKFIEKLNTLQNSAGKKIDKSGGSSLENRFYKACGKFLDGIVKTTEFISNMNNTKDIIFKHLCTGGKSRGVNPLSEIFSGLSVSGGEKSAADSRWKLFWNKFKDSSNCIITNLHNVFIKIVKKPYNAITKGFDSISRFTVKRGYKKAAGSMNTLEDLIRQYSSKLPANKKADVEQKLNKAAIFREYFSGENTMQRLDQQGKLMSNLENNFIKKCNSFMLDCKSRIKKDSGHKPDKMSFWSQDILMTERSKIEQNGQEAVEKLTGRVGGEKGCYNEILELIKPHISSREYSILNKSMQKAAEKLNKANRKECIEYFDKKRDLVLGSAPTDVLTAIVGLSLSGAAISAAHNRDERISRTVTGAVPVATGLGASMAYTAMLFSGFKSILMGALTGITLSLMGNYANHNILSRNNIHKKTQEVISV